MAGICKHKIASNGECNYHIFLNSVDDIGSIIRTAKLTPENTRVICSQSEDTLRKNLAKLPEGFTISKALDPLRSISFYTSTCFEGQDIIDTNGRSFIVSNGKKDHTLMDISTSFIQVCGRIRKSKYNEEIVHFYSTSRYSSDVSLEEFEKATYEAVNKAEEFAEWFNTSPKQYKSKLINQVPYINEPYVKVKDESIIVDRNLANFDIINYKVVNGIYQLQTNVISELINSGLQVTDSTAYSAPKNITLMAKYKLPFKALFDLYCQIKKEQPMYSIAPDYRLELIEARNPLIKEAYDKLGQDEVQKMKYHQSNIRRKLITLSNDTSDYKIVKLVNEVFSPQAPILVSKVKTELQRIYDSLGVKKTAKATDLKSWYEIKEHTTTINDKSVACITIVRSKLLKLNELVLEF